MTKFAKMKEWRYLPSSQTRMVGVWCGGTNWQGGLAGRSRDINLREVTRSDLKARSGCEWCPDVLSIERLAAEAEAGGKRTSELEGAGITRIDIYWRSRTVCTCRIQTARQARTTATPPATRRDTSDFGPRYGEFRRSPPGI